MSWQLRSVLTRGKALVRAGGVVLIPIPFRRSILEDSEVKSQKLHDTSYLDGFRGVVAFLVFVRHFTLPWQADLDYGYLHGDGHDGLLRLPVLRLLYSGPNVPVMLVVSGFVLSLKPLKLMQSYQWDKLYHTAASSAFRRAIRLFPPPILSTAFVWLAVQANMFSFPYSAMPGKAPRHPPHLGFWQQAVDWLRFVMLELTYPWTWKSPMALYGAHLWTTPLQYRCSMVLTLVLVALGRTRPVCRVLSVLGLSAYSLVMGRWDVALYLGGMFIADMDIRSKNRTSAPLEGGGLTNMAWPRSFSRHALLAVPVAGLYMSSFPRQKAGDGAPGYQWCSALTPDYRNWHACGALLLVASVCLYKPVQSVFNTALAHYLGKLSFSLYIVHEPLLHVYGFRCVELAWRLTSKSTALRYQSGFLLGFAMTLPVVLWVADLFYRLVDQPCARLSSWADKSLNRSLPEGR